jgi:hypothetical protein
MSTPAWDGESLCVDCGAPARHERLSGMAGEDVVVEMVCERHLVSVPEPVTVTEAHYMVAVDLPDQNTVGVLFFKTITDVEGWLKTADPQRRARAFVLTELDIDTLLA